MASRHMMVQTLPIQLDRLMTEIEQLSLYSDAAAPAVTRILYTDTDLAARHYLRQLAEAAGFEWRTDAVGNSFVRWPGARPDLPPVATGSHIDAVPYAGKYDGVVGVLGGLEALRCLRAAGFAPQRSLELIVFTAEEPTRFGLGCIGSRILAGKLSTADLHHLRDAEGVGFEEARQAAGFQGEIESVPLTPGSYAAFVELHIEQGPVLEATERTIGIVTGIAASTTATATFAGSGGHAGTVPMHLRHDPLLAAAEFALAAERTALQSGPDAVATVGAWITHPGASNSIPRHVQLSLDVRNVDEAVRDQMVQTLAQSAQQLATQRGLAYTFDIINNDPALLCAPPIMTAVENTTRKLALPAMRLVSRAYHDTVFMGAICPVGMVFIPCRHGYSHRPDEYATPEHIAAGVQVLALTLAELVV
jgi:N-carbamoyl-L-amino-acid hydrolase